MLNILTDSCADLSQPLIDAHGLHVIPLHVLVSGKDHHDNELTLGELFSMTGLFHPPGWMQRSQKSTRLTPIQPR